MKIIQMILAVALFVLSGIMFATQTIITGSLFVSVMFGLLWALAFGLVRLSWQELKEELER